MKNHFVMWLLENKSWLFSGAGIFIISLFTSLFFKNKRSNIIKLSQKSGKNSFNIQSTKNINLTLQNKEEDMPNDN